MIKYPYFYDLEERIFGEIHLNFAAKFTDLNFFYS